jgi:hypothetical protein
MKIGGSRIILRGGGVCTCSFGWLQTGEDKLQFLANNELVSVCRFAGQRPHAGLWSNLHTQHDLELEKGVKHDALASASRCPDHWPSAYMFPGGPRWSLIGCEDASYAPTSESTACRYYCELTPPYPTGCLRLAMRALPECSLQVLNACSAIECGICSSRSQYPPFF